MLIAIGVIISIPAAFSQTIIDNGNTYGVNGIGTPEVLTIPNNPQIKAITFTLRGGDGGYAEVYRDIGSGSVKSDGGQGAIVSATIQVGNSSGMLPLGTMIRFLEGERGISGTSTAVFNAGFDYGGGGGGSAISFKTPYFTYWTLLAVAGGGGGAYREWLVEMLSTVNLVRAAGPLKGMDTAVQEMLILEEVVEVSSQMGVV